MEGTSEKGQKERLTSIGRLVSDEQVHLTWRQGSERGTTEEESAGTTRTKRRELEKQRLYSTQPFAFEQACIFEMRKLRSTAREQEI